MTDEEIILKHDPRVRPRAKMELKIVNALLEAAEKAGYKLIEREENEEATKDLLFNLDEAYIEIYDPNVITDDSKHGKYLGTVLLVFGNDGWDLISDYHTRLEDFLKPVLEVSDKLQNGLD
jgi:predicted fused transcriptional regulator/phosphomethylpyrimidine kinase